MLEGKAMGGGDTITAVWGDCVRVEWAAIRILAPGGGVAAVKGQQMQISEAMLWRG